MNDIVNDAKEWLDEQPKCTQTHSENCHKWHSSCLVDRLLAEIARLDGALNVVAASLSDMKKGLKKHLLKLPPEPETKETTDVPIPK